jgi:hypothetical protein
MTPNEKGRFCQSCTKTVIDFTKMNTGEIQDYIHNNKNQRICGHIKQSQLDVINLRIPETVFNQTLNFNRLFLLALLLAMGTSLLNCSDNVGKKQKFNSVEIIETNQKIIDTISKNVKTTEVKTDSVSLKKTKPIKPKIKEKQIIDGLMIIETVGDIQVEQVDPEDIEELNIDSLEIETPPFCPKPPEDEILVGLMIVEHPPEFKDTPKNLSRSEKKEYLSKKVSQIITDNFNVEIASDLSLKGKQRIYTQFKIDENGLVKDIKVRSSSHNTLEEEAIRVINLLPKFKPAKHRDKNVSVMFTLPIVFVIED